MRIALIRARYNPYGGAERFMSRAIAALAARGESVTLIAREWDEAATREAGVMLQRCDPFHLGSVWRDMSFARGVREIVASGNFDLVQSHERIAGLDVYRAGDGVHAEWLAQRRRVLSAAGRLALCLNPYHRYVLDAERRMFADARLRAVVCNSAMVRDEIRAHFGVSKDKLHVICNGVDAEYFHPRLRDAHRAAVRSRLGFPEDAAVFLLVGSGFARKGVPVLLAALERLPGTRAIIVGTDKRLARYRDGAPAGVVFLGGQDDVRPYYGAADAFVLPALYDPQPNAAIEALACGLPVVTSTKCGAAELLEEGVSGFVRDAADIAGFAGAMRLAADPARNPAMRGAARNAAEPLTLDLMASRLLTLYRTLLAERRVEVA
jgi:UDP-glucose:(heptosyl)LPS alpha-1,3-glucosyltransferase